MITSSTVSGVGAPGPCPPSSTTDCVSSASAPLILTETAEDIRMGMWVAGLGVGRGDGNKLYAQREAIKNAMARDLVALRVTRRAE